MKGGVLVGIVLLLIISLLVGACAKAPAPATPAPGTPAATPTPTPAAVKPIVLKYTSFSARDPKYNPSIQQDIWFLEEITKRSAAMGKPIKWEEYWGGALGASMLEVMEVVRSGQADVGKICPTCGAEDWFRWESSINQIFLMIKTHEEVIRIVRILFDEFPEFQEQWAGVNARALTTQSVGPYGFVSKVPIKTLADLKGKKFYTWGSYVPKIVNAAQAVPVAIATTDVYDAIKSGLLDGRYSSLEIVQSSKLYEVGPYYIMAETGCVRSTPNFMNLKTYNSLPADLRKMVDDVSRESDDYYIQRLWVEKKNSFDFLKGKVTYYRMSKEDNDAWLKAAGGLYGMLDDWVNTYMKKFGLQVKAKQIADRIKQLAEPSWKNPASQWSLEAIPEWVLKSPVTGQVIGKPYAYSQELPELFK